jgi:hypothetical protein
MKIALVKRNCCVALWAVVHEKDVMLKAGKGEGESPSAAKVRNGISG